MILHSYNKDVLIDVLEQCIRERPDDTPNDTCVWGGVPLDYDDDSEEKRKIHAYVSPFGGKGEPAAADDIFASMPDSTESMIDDILCDGDQLAAEYLVEAVIRIFIHEAMGIVHGRRFALDEYHEEMDVPYSKCGKDLINALEKIRKDPMKYHNL